MKRLLLSALCAVPAFCIGQTLLYNDGAMIKVQAGATLYVEGGIQNTATGTIDNDGTIEVKGNFINAGTWEPSQPNTLKFTGNVNSDVTSGTAQFQTVIVQKDATFNVNLMDNMTINTQLNFNAAGASRVVTNNFDLKMGTAGTVIGYDADEYVATTGTGMMQKAVTANGTYEFPIGDITNYSPISSTYTGSAYASANIRAKANDLTHPNKPTDATDYISRYWDVNATGITTYSNTLTGTYIPADLVGTAALVKGAVYDGAAWKYAGAAAGANTAIGSTTVANADFTGTNFFGKADIIVYLQGAYNNGFVPPAPAMTTTMNTGGIIPLTSPYADAAATVGAIPANVTDWIKIELRDPASPSTVLGKASVFLKNDGHVVGLDGTSLPIVKNGKPTSIVNFIHMSHLPVRTPDAGINVVDPTPYDFSTGIGQAYDNPAVTTNDAMKQMPDGKFVMWGGNANGNGNVRYTLSSGDESYLLGTVLGGNTATIITGPAAYNGANMNMNLNIRYTLSSGDEAFLLGNCLGGNTATIINQHQ